jgi:hypothetical protein
MMPWTIAAPSERQLRTIAATAPAGSGEDARR